MGTIAIAPSRDLLTASAAAHLLGISVSSLRQWARDGLVPHQLTPGGHRRFDRDDLTAWLEARGGELPDEDSGLCRALVAGRIAQDVAAATALADGSAQIVSGAVRQAAGTTLTSGRRVAAIRARAEERLAELITALAEGDVSACLRAAEWHAYREGATRLSATESIGEWLALASEAERYLRASGISEADIQAVRDAVDRVVSRATTGLAIGRRSRAETRIHAEHHAA